MELINATLIGFLVGISGTVAGGLFILRFGSSSNRQSFLLGFSGGVMVAVVLFDLWLEAIHYGGIIITALGTAVGVFLIQYFDQFLKLIPWYRNRNLSKLNKVGLLMGLGIGVHNFPEGVALGTTYIANPALKNWLGLALIMALHNIPEGMVMSSTFKLGKVPFYKIIIALILVELPMAFGSTVGGALGLLSNEMIAASLGFAGGAMFFLVAKEILPMAKKISGVLSVTVGFLIGLLIGIMMISFI
ncbi:MAG TPA: hypothetical protein PLZ08_10170 [Bacillota bacterium]|jgi:ZIP family zinc transporter|nr:hypothetical protein [Bacillota bacterium]HOL10100.1 hypothetical protein [Bacillota bacterium]HPO98303.1 hypothetical protein [Bacillota bacterium]